MPIIFFNLILIYAGLILYFILKYGVDVPYNDQWEYVSFFDHLAKGNLTFNELFKLQGEYRQLFPNLIFVGLGSLTGWNVKYEMVVIFIMACLISWCIFYLATRTLSVDKWQRWLVFLLANIFIFSPCQYENWLFGVQIEYFIPILCLTTGMVIIYSDTRAIWKLIICIVLSTISTLSCVNGLICWFLLFPIYYLANRDLAFFKKSSVVYAWIIAAFIAIAIYFVNYKKPVSHPSTSLFLENPLGAIKYFFGVLGNPLRIVHKLDVIIVVGAVLFTVFCLLVVYIIRYRRNKALVRNSIVWIMLGLYSLGTSALVTVGRLGFGLFQSLTPRYTSFSLYLIVSIFFLAAIILKDLSQKIQFNWVYKMVITIIIVLLLFNNAGKYKDSVTDLKNFHASILHGKAGLLLINSISHETCENKIYPFEFERLQTRAITLDSLGLLRPGLVKSNIVQDFEAPASKTYCEGSLDTLIRIDDTSYMAKGHTKLSDTHGPADAVLFSYDYYYGKSVLFAICNKDSISWKKTIIINKIPFDTVLVKAWAFDATTGKAYQIGQKQIIKNPLD